MKIKVLLISIYILLFSLNSKLNAQCPTGVKITAINNSNVHQVHDSFEVITLEKGLVYDVSRPTIYTNSSYGTYWNATITTSYSNGTPVNSLDKAIWLPPTSSTNGYITFTPRDTVVDSTLIICLYVKDLLSNCIVSYCRKVLIAPSTYTDFTYSNDTCDNDTIQFTSICSVSSDTMTYKWEFDDNGDTSISTNPNHIFSKPGPFNVKLTSTTSPWGFKSSKTKKITIHKAPLCCEIMFVSNQANGPRNYTFKSSCDGVMHHTEKNVSYKWEIENHGTKSGPIIDVNFSTEGNFSVKLTATNDSTGCQCGSTINHNNVGLITPANLKTISIYPNPIEDNFQLFVPQELMNSTFIIHNSLGQIVKTGKIVNTSEVISIETLKNGVYFLELKDRKSNRLKIVKN